MTRYINKIPILVSAKEIRDGRRYKQKDIAIGSGLPAPIVSRLMREDDISGVTYASVRAIAEWLGVTMEELAERE